MKMGKILSSIVSIVIFFITIGTMSVGLEPQTPSVDPVLNRNFLIVLIIFTGVIVGIFLIVEKYRKRRDAELN